MRRVVLAILSTVVALTLLLSFKSHPTTSVASPPAVVRSTASTTGGNDSTASSGSTKTSKKTATTKTTATTTTVTGDAAETQYGPVQVQITVSAGKVTAVRAIEYPNGDPRDAQINSSAIPLLNQEATRAGNATIDVISGATYTSDGYIQSLQSALDKAGS
jgi:uncharacterized protein with FMN-binding domain